MIIILKLNTIQLNFKISKYTINRKNVYKQVLCSRKSFISVWETFCVIFVKMPTATSWVTVLDFRVVQRNTS